jgi:hypothetical protein
MNFRRHLSPIESGDLISYTKMILILQFISQQVKILFI